MFEPCCFQVSPLELAHGLSVFQVLLGSTNELDETSQKWCWKSIRNVQGKDARKKLTLQSELGLSKRQEDKKSKNNNILCVWVAEWATMKCHHSSFSWHLCPYTHHPHFVGDPEKFHILDLGNYSTLSWNLVTDKSNLFPQPSLPCLTSYISFLTSPCTMPSSEILVFLMRLLMTYLRVTCLFFVSSRLFVNLLFFSIY